MRSRITTGVSGLDSMLCGGIPEGDQVIVVGGPGAGKTLLGFEFIYKNAKLGYNGLYVSLEENEKSLINNAKDAFTDFTDIDALLDERKIVIAAEDINTYVTGKTDTGEPEYAFASAIAEIVSRISANGATRVVVDSLSVLKALIKQNLVYRSLMMSLVYSFRRLGVTSLLIAEMKEYDVNRLKFPTECFLFDGLIMMHSATGTEKTRASIEIFKMRGTDHTHIRVPYMIQKSGVDLLSLGNFKEE